MPNPEPTPICWWCDSCSSCGNHWKEMTPVTESIRKCLCGYLFTEEECESCTTEWMLDEEADRQYEMECLGEYE